MTVYGAYGHTGRFAVAELVRRGWAVLAVGRDAQALADVRGRGVTAKAVTVDEADMLAGCARGSAAILNCAGPFGATAAPLAAAAIGAAVPYVDTTGEPEVVAPTFERFSVPAGEPGVPVVPAAAFFGALGDILGTAALGSWDRADSISIAYALDEWTPTVGTRRAIQQMNGRRRIYRDGQPAIVSTPFPQQTWAFPLPVGRRAVVGEYPAPETVLLPHHARTTAVHAYMTVEAIQDLRDPSPGAPVAVDDEGRSAQSFLVHAEAARGSQRYGVWAQGRDIYATSAVIAVTLLERLLDGPQRSGVLTPAEIFGSTEYQIVTVTSNEDEFMRAYQFEDDFSIASLRLVERPDPVPGERDIVLRMRAVALNYRDLAIMRGEYHARVSPPLVPLSDGAGEVVRVGTAVTRFRVGDLACPIYLPDWVDGPIRPHHGNRRLGGPGDGVLAELVCLSEDEAVRAPGHLEPAEAATLPVAGLPHGIRCSNWIGCDWTRRSWCRAAEGCPQS